MFRAKAKQLREQRAKLILDAQELLKKDQMSVEDRAKFDQMMADADVIKADIDRNEKADIAETELRGTTRPPLAQPGEGEGSGDDKEKREQAQKAAFRRYLYGGEGALRPEDRSVLRRGDNGVAINEELRDMGVGTGAGGGFFVPTGFVYDVEEALKAYGGMVQVATPLDTSTGNSLPYPTENDTTNMGELVGENQPVSDQDLAIGNVIFNAYKYSTKMVKVSLELLQDSAFDLPKFIAKKFGIRLGRITNLHYTTGDNIAKPQGLLVGSANAGNSAAVGSISYDDFVTLEHSVDPAYRSQGAKWMFNDQTLKLVKMLKDSLGRPLFLPGMAVKAPDTILNYQYVINQDMPDVATGNKAVAFGAMDRYHIRNVKELSVLRLNERFAENGQVAFIGFARKDGRLVDAGTNPVKYLTIQ